MADDCQNDNLLISYQYFRAEHVFPFNNAWKYQSRYGRRLPK